MTLRPFFAHALWHTTNSASFPNKSSLCDGLVDVGRLGEEFLARMLLNPCSCVLGWDVDTPVWLLVVGHTHRWTQECAAIGIATSRFPLFGRFPGWDRFSYGFHSDDGKVFHDSGRVRELCHVLWTVCNMCRL